MDIAKGVISLRQQDGGHGSWHPHKDCVTTHLPNEIALKIDVVKRCRGYPTLLVKILILNTRGKSRMASTWC